MRISGAIAPATLLQIPIILILFAALSIGPRIVIYGLDAVCKMVNPVACTNKPSKNILYPLTTAAGIKIKVPIDMIHRPTIIPFLKPVLFRIKEEGIAITK
jgi:hypothetical protein